MPSFAISQFIILLEPLWVSAVFLLLSTGPLLYIIAEPIFFIITDFFFQKTNCPGSFFAVVFLWPPLVPR